MLADIIIPTVKMRSFPNQRPQWIHPHPPERPYCCLQIQPRIRPHGRMQISLLQTRTSGEGHKENVQRHSGDADGVARHQALMARATNYHGLPGQNLLKCEYRHIPNGGPELILCSVRAHSLCDRAQREEGSEEDKLQVLMAYLETYTNQLCPAFTTIFNLSVAESEVLACFKWSSIVPVPKTASPACLNDCRQVTLTLVVIKCR